MLCSASQSIADKGVSAYALNGKIKQKSQNLLFIQNHRYRRQSLLGREGYPKKRTQISKQSQ